MLGQKIRIIYRQIISEEDEFIQLSDGDTEAETKIEILAGNHHKFHATEILKTETENKCKKFTSQYNTLYQHAHYWQKSDT